MVQILTLSVASPVLLVAVLGHEARLVVGLLLDPLLLVLLPHGGLYLQTGSLL